MTSSSDTTAAAADIGARFGLGKINQIAFAVADLDRSLPLYTALFGPFERRQVAQQANFRGAPTTVQFDLAFSNRAGIEVELVAVKDGDAPQVEHLRAHGDGLHHVRFSPDDYDRAIGALLDGGFALEMNGLTRDGRKFAYLSAPDLLGTTRIELLQSATPA